MKSKDLVTDALITALLYTSVLGSIVVGGTYVYKQAELKRGLAEKIIVKADIDPDGVLDNYEWAGVLQVVKPDIRYDAKSLFQELSIEEMQKYLSQE